MNDLIRNDLIVDKQIKDEFYLYAFKDEKFKELYFELRKISGLKKQALNRFGYIFNTQSNKLEVINERFRLKELERKITSDKTFFFDIRNYCLKVIRRDRWPTGKKVKPVEKIHHKLLVKKTDDCIKNPTVSKADEILNSLNRHFAIDEINFKDVVRIVKFWVSKNQFKHHLPKVFSRHTS